MKKYDVIVIGAGNGGLVAAATAAKRGLSTLLLERHNLPGGAATSFTRGRFEFEPSLHELANYGTPEMPGSVRQLFDWLGLHVKFHEAPGAYRVIKSGPDGFDAVMPTGQEAFINKLEELVPGSRESVTKFFDLGMESLMAFAEFQAKPNNIDWHAIGEKYPHFIHYAKRPYKEVLDELNVPQKAQDIMMAYWCYIGVPGDDFEFAYMGMMLVAYVVMGAYVPTTRSHEISTAILQTLLNNYGDAWFNTEVNRIVVENGKAVGVQIGKETIYGREIIADVIPTTVYGKMMRASDVPERGLKLANARTLGTSGFLVYLGLNKSPEELGIKDYSVFISKTADSSEQFSATKERNKQNDFTIMNCLNLADPGCSPAGTSVLYATKLYFGSSWDDVQPENYAKVKDEIAQQVIDQYESATGVKIRDAVEEIEIATPETFARYLRSPEGEIYGYYGHPWDQMLARTMAINEDDQQMPHLHFCGGSGFLMDGYSSAYQSGFVTANMVAEQLAKQEVTK
ncbi:phytoene desaturase family protein [Furfurilactobacillus rossiae]|uniref:GDP dissociation inhibitor n=1 Tax=Furfurilactobacillus rossiae DSM 15814 TaxID=1114972 RepID=A0A0R1R720_9LACO|nr:NAD(P)/FAD-dependent oxidoreductase [Furfurilactobacillus rossiae]KRL53101.1 GDP dissociation inhibitor [Furfurilactobacillus rossiae DSM 15814]QLE60223.1 Carotenoid cis-trans isomerase [Furfurilactobacillus rossiae]